MRKTKGSVSENRMFRLDLKEWITLIFGTALALGSFKSDDPMVVIPMLVIAGLAFVGICVNHYGKASWRIISAAGLLTILFFIGWRDLHHKDKDQQIKGTSEVPTIVIKQKSHDSTCTNISGGNNVNVDCSDQGNKKNNK